MWGGLMAFTASRVPGMMRPPQRRHRTGRNAQLNFKVTPETLAQFAAIADREKCSWPRRSSMRSTRLPGNGRGAP